ncbi:MAG: hypothetical protein B7Y07_08130 [Halothiobacillus sp. 24-54-40]|jgi:hypothetical protein|nr:MAG: hypothetical protein B7X12_06940 [Halothiobacillus sp. 20-53-49]OYY37315.1 MAG: hypothetical protein B7Y58_06430 [Halothiobacillus sp. 35-54-62]OYZ86425.1 MAG: hypothetical protein B7Y07_08130 [Halothiobacillus sp. 24-54-40]OZA80326.1 MAG: hypothetical protein B7X64_06350 [Halothiobacillus sp. 39-53-45]HQS03174.1 hypothetical protein [Halothiobacillus sp.]
MADSNQAGLMQEVLDIMARGEAPWQQSRGNDDRLAADIEPANISTILEQFDKALNGHPYLMEVANNRLHGDVLSKAINAKPHAGLSALWEHGTFDQMLDVAEREGNLDALGKAVSLMEQATKTRLTQMGFEADAFRQVDQTMGEMVEKLNTRGHEKLVPEIEKIVAQQKEQDYQNSSAIEPSKKTEFDQLVTGQNLVIEKAVDDGMSYVGTVAGEDGGTVIVKVGDHRAVAMSKARMEGDVEVGENSRFGYENQYGNDERGRAIRDKNVELGGQRYAVIDMDDLVQQNRRSIMGKVLAVGPDAVYTKFGKDADGRDQLVAHNSAKLDVIPALGSFATINYGANGLGKLVVKEQAKGLDQQIER